MRKREEEIAVKDFGLSPDEFEEEIYRLQPFVPAREKDVEVTTKNVSVQNIEPESGKTEMLRTKDIEEQIVKKENPKTKENPGVKKKELQCPFNPTLKCEDCRLFITYAKDKKTCVFIRMM